MIKLTLAKALHLLLLAALVVWLGWGIFLLITVGDPEFGIWPHHFFAAWPALCAQALYPMLHWATAKLPWTTPWRVVRGLHLAVVLLALLGLGLLVLATPDVSGFTS